MQTPKYLKKESERFSKLSAPSGIFLLIVWKQVYSLLLFCCGIDINATTQRPQIKPILTFTGPLFCYLQCLIDCILFILTASQHYHRMCLDKVEFRIKADWKLMTSSEKSFFRLTISWDREIGQWTIHINQADLMSEVCNVIFNSSL